MNRVMTILIAGAFATSLAACNRAEDPAETRADVAAAQSEARQDVAEAQSDLNQSVLEGQQQAALAKAEGDHKVAIEQCEALPAAQQSACKDEADANFDAAKAAAEFPGPT